MVDRTRARYLAPAAMIVAILGAVIVVRENSSTHSPSVRTSAAASRLSHRGRGRRRFYVVQAGDSLTSIATRTAVPLTRLESLNHLLDPNSLQAGRQLRLRP